MKIYQLHEYSGEYEDFRDYIIGSYLRKERAEEEKIKAEQAECTRQERYKKCNDCPIIDTDLQSGTFEAARNLCSKYCNHAQIYEDKFGFDCENYEGNWDEATYQIKEVEVEE